MVNDKEQVNELLGFARSRPKTKTITVKRRPPEEPSLRDKVIAKRKEYAKQRMSVESSKPNEREYDYEGEMAKVQLRGMIRNAQEIMSMLEDNTNMAEWVQNKITKAADYIDTARDYMMNDVQEAIMVGKVNSNSNDYARQKTSTGIRTKKMVGSTTTGNKNREQLRALKKPVTSENFIDGKNPEDKGDSKRHGVPTKASVSKLRKVAKQGGRKGQLAHWMANMKAGKAKNK